MKLLNVEQIREWDQYTIQNKPIASIDLMESAANAFVGEFQSIVEADKKVRIFCGPGNNGGDGLAIARLLLQQKYKVKVFVIDTGGKYSEDFKVNKERLEELKEVHFIKEKEDIPECESGDVVIDAMFGSGLDRPVKGIFADIIQALNNTPDITRVAVDMPSGLFSDQPNNDPVIFQAHYTLTFQVPKYSFLFAQNEAFVGKFRILDIGLSREFLKNADTSSFFMEADDIAPRLTSRHIFAHKGHFGHSLIIAGQYGKIGAAVLSAKACLRSGTGLLTTYIPECGYSIMQTSLPEAMVLTDPSHHQLSSIPDLSSYSVIGTGPGIGESRETVKAFEELINNFRKPMVIDADGINILAHNPRLLSKLPAYSILTPHPGEFRRLAGESKNDYDRAESVANFAVQHKLFVVLKGKYTLIACPDGKKYFNATGNPGMATAGTGDTLTGILTGIISQGYNIEDAAIAGVYIHGLAGDKAIHTKGETALIASDIIDEGLLKAFKEFKI